MPTLADLAHTPNALAPHYSAFEVSRRLLLSGHSHQAWPDVARDGLVESYEDAALHVDEKWARAFAKAERVRQGYRALLDDPVGEIALAASTHELVVRWLSGLDLRRRPRLVTTDGEFHTLRRQLSRLVEEGFEIHREPARPIATLAERLAGRIDDRSAAVMVSAIFFETAAIVPGLGELAAACAGRGVPLLVDAYHSLGAVPFSLGELGLESALVTGGGYKYLQLGEGNAFLRLPPGLDLRPAITGWFAEFAAKSAPRSWHAVEYGAGAAAFGGATYDPASHYRAARVFEFFVEQELSPDFLRRVSQHQVGLLAERFDDLGLAEVVATRDRETPLDRFGAFLAIETPHAESLSRRLLEHGVFSDARGSYLRLGPAPYLCDAQLETAMAIFGELASRL